MGVCYNIKRKIINIFLIGKETRFYIMDELENVKSKIRLLDYIQNAGNKIKSLGGETYGVNPCPICGHNDSFRIYDATNSYNCFSEDKGGDILNYMQDVEGLTFMEAKEKLYKITNTPIAEYKPKENKHLTNPRQTTQKQTPQEIDAINKIVMQEFNKKANTDELIKYLNNRNISKSAIDKYHLFISKEIDKQCKRLYIPIIENGKAIAYIGRALEENAKLRYRNSKGTIQPLNLDYLKHKLEAEQSNAIYICEGIFDAISIEEQGKKAISLNSTQNKTKLIEAITENIETAKDYLYIIATDNDEAGQKVKTELQNEFNKLNIRNTYLEIPKEYKDVNEWYCNVQRETFEEILEQSIYNKYNEKTIDYYIGTSYLEEIKKASRYPLKKTGFKQLDGELNGGIREGLYIIGAIPSLGKTTFTLQLADNIAKQNNKVIIFSLEQSRFELVSKAISRLTWEHSPRKC